MVSTPATRIVVPKSPTFDSPTLHPVPRPPEGPDRQRGVRDVDCAFPDPDRSACLSDRPAPLGLGGQCPLDLAMHSPFCYCYCLVRRGGNGLSRPAFSSTAASRSLCIEGIDKDLAPTGNSLHLGLQGNQRTVSSGNGKLISSHTGWEGTCRWQVQRCGLRHDGCQVSTGLVTVAGSRGCLPASADACCSSDSSRSNCVPCPIAQPGAKASASSLISLHQLRTLSGPCLC